MAKPISGLQPVVSQLRKERTNLVNQLRHVDAALSVLGKLNGGRFYTQPRHRKMSAAARARKQPPGGKGGPRVNGSQKMAPVRPSAAGIHQEGSRRSRERTKGGG